MFIDSYFGMNVLIPINLENVAGESLKAIDGLLGGANDHQKTVFKDIIRIMVDASKDLKTSEILDNQKGTANYDLIEPEILEGLKYNKHYDSKGNPDKIDENLDNLYPEKTLPPLTVPIAFSNREEANLSSGDLEKAIDPMQKGIATVHLNGEGDLSLFKEDGLTKPHKLIVKTPLENKELFLDQVPLSQKNEITYRDAIAEISKKVLARIDRSNDTSGAITKEVEKILDQGHTKLENPLLIRKQEKSYHFVGSGEQESENMKHILKESNFKRDSHHTLKDLKGLIFNDDFGIRITKEQGINAQSQKLVSSPGADHAFTQIKDNVIDNEYLYKPSDSLRTESDKSAFSLEGINKNAVEDLKVASQDVKVLKETSKIFENASITTKNNSSSINISIDTNELGMLDIELVLERGMINGHINTTDAIGKELIERNLYKIIESLTKEGLNIGGFSVSLRHKGEEAHEDRDNQRNINKREDSIEDIDRPTYYLNKGTINIFV